MSWGDFREGEAVVVLGARGRRGPNPGYLGFRLDRTAVRLNPHTQQRLHLEAFSQLGGASPFAKFARPACADSRSGSAFPPIQKRELYGVTIGLASPGL